MNSLELQQLHKSYGTLSAVHDVSLNLPAGSRTVIVGPSGSGKTTLLRMIAGFEFPDRGRISLNGQVLAAAPWSTKLLSVSATASSGGA